MRKSENGWSIEEAGMAQLDDIVGAVMKYLKDAGWTENTIVVFTTDNGAENFTWPDGGQTPFAGGKGTALEGGFRVPAIIRWPGKVPAGESRERHHVGAGLVPDLRRGCRQPEHRRRTDRRARSSAARPTRSISTATTRLDFITGKGPSARNEIFYFAESTLGAVRIDDYKYRFTDQPGRLARQHGQSRLADP